MATVNHDQLSALAELLKPQDTSDDQNISSSSLKESFQSPAQIGPPKKSSEAAKETLNHNRTREEMPECNQLENESDTRATPEYEILFKQNVSAEDVFLGMSGRNPSTACCEDLVFEAGCSGNEIPGSVSVSTEVNLAQSAWEVKIRLPDSSYSNVKLNVTDTYLDCQTPKYKLGLHFPHVVDSKCGKARWEADQNLLTVTVPMRREYDYLNIHS